ncbi:MAG: hypothetical protein FWF90_17435 [Promicromonosporaceae bacterium]|nr:hypothetical protein [Promicromonosporaceae bacterium]
MKPRLQAAARNVADARESYRAAIESRNDLIETAVDGGMSQRKVAQAAGVSLSRVTAVLLHLGAGVELN